MDKEEKRKNKVGERYVNWFKELCGLRPEESVLDIGCRDGKMAKPLSKYLTGRYEGFDIDKKEIEFCQKEITSKNSNFNFQVVDLFNGTYNPTGKLPASKFKFPYKDKIFDFIFLTSVFTHMFPKDIEHYISEITRVLKDNGRCLITFFLINDEVRQLMKDIDPKLLVSSGTHRRGEVMKFIDCGIYNTIDEKIPERAIAYEERIMKSTLKNNGLKVKKVYYGYWCGRKKNFLSYQDIIIVEKNG